MRKTCQIERNISCEQTGVSTSLDYRVDLIGVESNGRVYVHDRFESIQCFLDGSNYSLLNKNLSLIKMTAYFYLNYQRFPAVSNKI